MICGLVARPNHIRSYRTGGYKRYFWKKYYFVLLTSEVQRTLYNPVISTSKIQIIIISRELHLKIEVFFHNSHHHCVRVCVWHWPGKQVRWEGGGVVLFREERHGSSHQPQPYRHDDHHLEEGGQTSQYSYNKCWKRHFYQPPFCICLGEKK